MTIVNVFYFFQRCCSAMRYVLTQKRQITPKPNGTTTTAATNTHVDGGKGIDTNN